MRLDAIELLFVAHYFLPLTMDSSATYTFYCRVAANEVVFIVSLGRLKRHGRVVFQGVHRVL